MRYSFNQNKEGIVFANAKDINASFKDLAVVCAAIRYKSVPAAIDMLDSTIALKMPIPFRKYNASMGSRHQLGGKKGRWPRKCAAVVRKVLVNAAANATNKGFEPDAMYVVHSAANKTFIGRRGPSKGALFVTGGPIGFVTPRHSDIEFSRVEIGISELDEKRLNTNMVRRIKATLRATPRTKAAVKPAEKKKAGLITKLPAKDAPAKPIEAAKPHPEKLKEVADKKAAEQALKDKAKKLAETDNQVQK